MHPTIPQAGLLCPAQLLIVITHKLSLYRHSSGALVFGAGTVQWSWGLDGNHWGGSTTTVSPEMQQATVNLFADMGCTAGNITVRLNSGISINRFYSANCSYHFTFQWMQLFHRVLLLHFSGNVN